MAETSQIKLYKIELTGLGTNTAWTISPIGDTLAFYPPPTTANTNYGPGCNITGNYDSTTNQITYWVKCPNSDARQILSNCSDNFQMGFGNVTCPMDDTLREFFRSGTLNTRMPNSFQETTNKTDNSWIWILVIAFIFFVFIMLARRNN